MKTKLLFLAKLILFSLLIAPLLRWFDLACRFALVFITSGAMPVDATMRAVPYVSSVKLYPFFVLMLATPNLTISKRSLGITGGILLYLILDLFMILVWKGMPFLQLPDPTFPHIIATNIWDMLGRWLLPFLLWFMIVYRQIGLGAVFRKSST